MPATDATLHSVCHWANQIKSIFLLRSTDGASSQTLTTCSTSPLLQSDIPCLRPDTEIPSVCAKANVSSLSHYLRKTRIRRQGAWHGKPAVKAKGSSIRADGSKLHTSWNIGQAGQSRHVVVPESHYNNAHLVLPEELFKIQRCIDSVWHDKLFARVATKHTGCSSLN